MRSEFIQQAWDLFNLRRFDQALESALRAASHEPEDYQAFYIQSLCHTNMGRTQAAVDAAHEAIRCAPERAAGYHAKAFAWLRPIEDVAYDRDERVSRNSAKNPRLKEIEELYLESIRLDPNWPLLWRALSHVLLLSRRPEEAEKAARRCLALDPHDQWGYIRLTHAQREQWRLEEAEETCLAGLRVHPNSSNLHDCLGWARLDRGAPGEAIAPLRESLRLWPEGGPAFEGLARAIKARYRLYRWAIGLRQWIDRQDPERELPKRVERWVVGICIIAAMFLSYFAFRSYGFAPTKMLLLVFGAGFLAYFLGIFIYSISTLVLTIVQLIAEVFAEFATDVILLPHPVGRLLLSGSERGLAVYFTVLGPPFPVALVVWIACLLAGFGLGRSGALAMDILSVVVLAPFLAYIAKLSVRSGRLVCWLLLLGAVGLWAVGHLVPAVGALAVDAPMLWVWLIVTTPISLWLIHRA